MFLHLPLILGERGLINMAMIFPIVANHPGEYFDSVLTYLSALCKDLPPPEAASVRPLLHELCGVRRKANGCAIPDEAFYLEC
jgi:hypothetical protein